ncbi:hypothetical protein D3C84_985270 [compost metagenome]
MRAQGIAGAHRHRGLLHQDQRLFTVPCHRFAHRHHLAQVSRAIVPGRCADRDEQHLAMLHREFLIAGEL